MRKLFLCLSVFFVGVVAAPPAMSFFSAPVKLYKSAKYSKKRCTSDPMVFIQALLTEHDPDKRLEKGGAAHVNCLKGAILASEQEKSKMHAAFGEIAKAGGPNLAIMIKNLAKWFVDAEQATNQYPLQPYVSFSGDDEKAAHADQRPNSSSKKSKKKKGKKKSKNNRQEHVQSNHADHRKVVWQGKFMSAHDMYAILTEFFKDQKKLTKEHLKTWPAKRTEVEELIRKGKIKLHDQAPDTDYHAEHHYKGDEQLAAHARLEENYYKVSDNKRLHPKHYKPTQDDETTQDVHHHDHATGGNTRGNQSDSHNHHRHEGARDGAQHTPQVDHPAQQARPNTIPTPPPLPGSVTIAPSGNIPPAPPLPAASAAQGNGIIPPPPPLPGHFAGGNSAPGSPTPNQKHHNIGGGNKPPMQQHPHHASAPNSGDRSDLLAEIQKGRKLKPVNLSKERKQTVQEKVSGNNDIMAALKAKLEQRRNVVKDDNTDSDTDDDVDDSEWEG